MSDRARRVTVYGRGPVAELLRAGNRRTFRIWLLPTRGSDRRLGEIRTLALGARVEIRESGRRELDERAGSDAHQGAVAEAEPLRVPALEEVANGSRLVIALDEVQDPQNLGAILRSAECAGASAVIVPRDRAAALTPAAVKVAEGAAEHVPVVVVTNLRRALVDLKDAGFWVVGLAAGGGRSIAHIDLTRSVTLVLGGEADGLRRLVAETCDELAEIPMRGRIGSLNVAAAAAVSLYEVVRQRS